jgi:hypothetical protein
MSEGVLNFPQTEKKLGAMRKPPAGSHPTDRAGEGLLALLHEAATFSAGQSDRLMDVAHDLSRQLAAIEDRINRLQSEADHFRNRAAGAEKWLELIQKEVEERLMRPVWPTQ